MGRILVVDDEGIEEYGVVDKKPKIEGRNMVMYLVPKKK